MSGTWCGQAEKKLEQEFKSVKGQKESAMKSLVRDTLLGFCGQDEEFAQAVVQGGSFADCMKEVARGVGGSISDMDAFRRAVSFYFPGADIQVTMRINLTASVEDSGGESGGEKSIDLNLLNLTDFL